MKIISLLTSLLLLLSYSSFATYPQTKNSKVEQAIVNAMHTFNIPGVAIAVVENNNIVFSKGFGVKEFGKSDIITADTLFGIASNTKAMTVALLAQLVDQHQLSWHTKVVDILPEFRLYNDLVTQEFTLIDLLSHRSGLGYGAGDLMIWPNRVHTEQYIFEGLQHLPQVSGYRTQFAYNNIMYIIAGKVIEKITKASWQQNIHNRLFAPIGMSNSVASFSYLKESAIKNKVNLAIPHINFEGKVTPIKSDYLTYFSSAGSVISSANDMAKWLQVLLNNGELNHTKPNDGKLYLGKVSGLNQLYSEEQAQLMWQSHINRKVSSSEKLQDRTHFSAYGLGWFLNDFHGMKLVHHSGGITGMVSKVALIPEQSIGIVIFTNQHSSAAINAIYREVFEAYVGIPNKDWVTFYSDQEKQNLKRDKSRISELTKSLEAAGNSSFPLKTYAKQYYDKWYGDVAIQLNNNKLRIEFSQTPALKGELVYYQDSSFVIRWDNKMLNADAYINFHMSEGGDVIKATLKPVSHLIDFSFNFEDLTLIPK